MLIPLLLIASCGMREGYGTFVELGDEDFSAKDYQGALTWYDKAYQLDSFNLELNWKIAESYRLHKDYKKAAFYYDI